MCDNCRHGFWACELQPGTRAHYRAHLHDFGAGLHLRDLHALRLIEIDEARKRGTSAREDQLSILSNQQLQHVMARKKVDPGFMKEVEAENAGRGVNR